MKLKIIVAITLAGTVFGCSTEQAPLSSASTEKKTFNESVGKPSAPINMSYKLLTENPVAGQEIEIQVAFSSSLNKAVSATMKSAENLTWISTDKSWQSSLSKTGQYESLPNLKVTAPENGIYYIHIVAQVVDNGVTQYKPFIIPLNIGNVERTLESPGEIVVDEKGQKVIIQKVDSSH